MSNIVERYTWEDSVIEAETLGLLPSGAVNLCLRLAKAINWKPGNHRKGMPSGLYWKNEEALKAVNSSRATYFRYRARLFELGFFTDERGNLIPQVPDLSQYKIEESQIETGESHIETEESQTDTPYSEDTYSEDVLSEDTYIAALRAAETQGDIENKEEKVEIVSGSVESPLVLNISNPGDSSLESEVVSSALDVEEVSSAAALGAETEEIEYVLSASEHEGEARRLFDDPTHRKGMEGALRARWCVMDAIPEPVTVSKTGIDLEDW